MDCLHDGQSLADCKDGILSVENMSLSLVRPFIAGAKVVSWKVKQVPLRPRLGRPRFRPNASPGQGWDEGKTGKTLIFQRINVKESSISESIVSKLNSRSLGDKLVSNIKVAAA
eukprot:jgi/Botrbrau1/2570/Bobra.0079s0054.1